jgi:hypothetical protein
MVLGFRSPLCKGAMGDPERFVGAALERAERGPGRLGACRGRGSRNNIGIGQNREHPAA